MEEARKSAGLGLGYVLYCKIVRLLDKKKRTPVLFICCRERTCKSTCSNDFPPYSFFYLTILHYKKGEDFCGLQLSNNLTLVSYISHISNIR